MRTCLLIHVVGPFLRRKNLIFNSRNINGFRAAQSLGSRGFCSGMTSQLCQMHVFPFIVIRCVSICVSMCQYVYQELHYSIEFTKVRWYFLLISMLFRAYAIKKVGTRSTAPKLCFRQSGEQSYSFRRPTETRSIDCILLRYRLAKGFRELTRFHYHTLRCPLSFHRSRRFLIESIQKSIEVIEHVFSWFQSRVIKNRTMTWQLILTLFRHSTY